MRTVVEKLILISVTLTALTLSGRLSAQDEPRVKWVGTFEEALALCKETGKPIMIHFNMNDEPACENMARSHLTNKEVLKLAENFICIVCSIGRHEDEEIVKNATGSTCRRFGSVTCDQHTRCHYDVANELLSSPTVTAPQFAFVNADRQIFLRRAWDMSSKDLIELMQRALIYSGKEKLAENSEAERKKLLEGLFKEASGDHFQRSRQAFETLAKRDDPEIIGFLIDMTNANKDEQKRLAAVQAIGDAQNANCLPTLCLLLSDRSAQLRRAACTAIRKLGMSEASKWLVKAFGVESSTNTKAAIMRTALGCAPRDKDVRQLLMKCLIDSKPQIRAHAARSCLGLDPNEGEFKKLMSLAKGDTDETVRAVACHAATTIVTRPSAKVVRGEAQKPMITYKEDVVAIAKKMGGSDRNTHCKTLGQRCQEMLAGTASDIDEPLEKLFDAESVFLEIGD